MYIWSDQFQFIIYSGFGERSSLSYSFFGSFEAFQAIDF
jgi:hypothetical protein